MNWGDLEKHNIFRVLVVLIVCVSLSFSVLVSPVSAASYDTYFVNAFDYGLPTQNTTLEDPGQCWQITGRNKLNQIYFDIPYTSISYVELDFWTLDVISATVGIATSGSSASIVGNMTVVSLGDGYFKAFYQVNPSTLYSRPFEDLSFWFGASMYPFNVTILGCRYISGSDFTQLMGRISVYQAGTSVGSQTQTAVDQPAVVAFGGSKTDIDQATWYCQTSLPDVNWRPYTGLDFTFSVLALSLTSCYAYCGDQIIPCEISYINMPSEGTAGTDPDQVDNYRKRIQFSVHVDLSELKANVSDQLVVYFSGTSSLNTTGNEVRLTSVIGLYQNTNVNFIAVWFQRVIDTIKEVFSDIDQYFTELGDRIEAIFEPEDATAALDEVVTDNQESLDSIDQIEQDYLDKFDSNKEVLTDAFEIGGFAVALTFCSSILSRAFNNLGDYQIVFILPVALGIVLFIFSRVRGVDIPRKNVQQDLSMTPSELAAAKAVQAELAARNNSGGG